MPGIRPALAPAPDSGRVLKCQTMSDPADRRPPECGTETPTGPCVLPAGHPMITVLSTAHEGHMSQSAADQNERDVFGPANLGQVMTGLGEILVDGNPVPGAVTVLPDGTTLLDLTKVADEVERRAHARGELAPWEVAVGVDGAAYTADRTDPGAGTPREMP